MQKFKHIIHSRRFLLILFWLITSVAYVAGDLIIGKTLGYLEVIATLISLGCALYGMFTKHPKVHHILLSLASILLIIVVVSQALFNL